MLTIDEVREHCQFVGKDIVSLFEDRIAQLHEILARLNAITVQVP